MSSRTNWILVVLAAALFAFIFFFERHWRKEPHPPAARILPSLEAAAATSVTVRPSGEIEIRADRTNDGWRLTRPVEYPANGAMIDALLLALEKLREQVRIAGHELKGRPDADKEFGFDAPTFSLIIQQGKERTQILIGKYSPLNEQVYVQVVGVDDVLAVDANLLRLIPRVAAHWRDPSVVRLEQRPFDRLLVTNGVNVVELERDAANVWRMVRPMEARVDNPRLDDLLNKLRRLRAVEFVSDEPGPDLEAYGLQPPAFEMAVAQGTNALAVLQFGKSPTNASDLLYVRRVGSDTIMLARKEDVAGWRAPHTDFRDRHLTVVAPGMVDAIEVVGPETFTLRQLTNGAWQISGTNSLPADTALVHDLLGSLGAIEIVQFVKDVVTPLDYPTYGFEPPARQYILRLTVTNAAEVVTNRIVADMSFGATQGERTFARRGDENAVYAVRASEFARLPAAAWQLRDRRIWNFSVNDVTRVAVHEAGKTLELLRSGTNQWALAPGSQGIINPGAVEEIVHRLGGLTASTWIEWGATNLASFGIKEDPDRITVETRRGEKLTVSFGGGSPRGFPFASTLVDGQPAIFEFPVTLFRLIQEYLRPAQSPP